MPAWSAHEDEIIRAHAKTHSAAQIAGLLPGRSRASVTGRAWRLGASLAKDETTRRELEHPRRRRRWASAPPVPPPASPGAWPRISGEALRMAARVTPRLLSLDRLDRAGCRWPYGEAHVLFCGEPVRAGSAYCGGHHGLAYVCTNGGLDVEALAQDIERREAKRA